MSEIKVGVVGCGGRMGSLLVRLVAEAPDMRLVAASERPGSAAVGRDAGEVAQAGPLGVVVVDDPAVLFRTADTVIEFSVPEATEAHVRLAAEHGTRHVIGTTGLSPAQEAAIREAAVRAPVAYAPNMSPVVTLFADLVRQVAAKLGPDYDIEIVEMHHKHKIDAPSGTAVALGKAAALGRGVQLDDVAQWSREGHTGARRAGDIGFAALRGGDVAGEHTVMFASAGERLELTHRCTDRGMFARGAIHVTRWLADKPVGLYDMRDVLGLGN